MYACMCSGYWVVIPPMPPVVLVWIKGYETPTNLDSGNWFGGCTNPNLGIFLTVEILPPV